MKKIINLFLVFAICLLSVTTAFAAGSKYVYDDGSMLPEDVESVLNQVARTFYKDYGIEVFIATNRGIDEKYAEHKFDRENSTDDGMMLAVNSKDGEAYIYTSGRMDGLLSDSDLNKLHKAYENEESPSAGMTEFLAKLSKILESKNVKKIPLERQKPRLVDDADLLTTSEEERLLDKLDEISERQQCDVAVVTVNSTNGKTPQAFADDYYDYNGYGMGEGDDGVMLVISMEERDWYVTTYGFGIKAMTDDALDVMTIEVKSHLSNANYYEAFSVYADSCDDYITQAKNGKPFTRSDVLDLDEIAEKAFISVVIALIVAFCVTAKLKAELKTVAPQRSASNYQRPNSLNITSGHETFLFKNVSKVKIQSSSSSGRSGGSRTHRSSSGRSHGGRGGKF